MMMMMMMIGLCHPSFSDSYESCSHDGRDDLTDPETQNISVPPCQNTTETIQETKTPEPNLNGISASEMTPFHLSELNREERAPRCS